MIKIFKPDATANRIRAHVILGLNWPASECGNAHPETMRKTCDLVTDILVEHEQRMQAAERAEAMALCETAEVQADRDAWMNRAMSTAAERDNLKASLAEVCAARDAAAIARDAAVARAEAAELALAKGRR